MSKKWLSITEAAIESNVHRQTIWRRCDDRSFETAVRLGTTWMIDKAEVIRWAEHYHSTDFEGKKEGNEDEREAKA